MARIFFDGPGAAIAARRWLADLDGDISGDAQAEGDFVPPIDVLDVDAGLEIVLDLPGVSLDSVALTYRGGVLIVSGVKRPTRCEHRRAAFHLAERCFGRFARAVKVSGAVDARHATATLIAGELRILLPRVEERRGEGISISVTRGDVGARADDA